jgi:hypothetical protein
VNHLIDSPGPIPAARVTDGASKTGRALAVDVALCRDNPFLMSYRGINPLLQWTGDHSPVRRAQGPEPVEGLTLAATRLHP